ncbi:nectin-3-like protein isoform X2 [Megalobrama amblycephala]|uniref:nectin-3-like protein isoform X2 n=1 Tax=Megalobrama amblycephala TaxID=75352 RepID=UPI002013C364|nr:nectin-3-like protein isoform X2 [Megalobrama amblycephala]
MLKYISVRQMPILQLHTSAGTATSPVNVSLTVDAVPVAGRSEVPLATCTASTAEPAAEVSWHLGTFSNSVRISTSTVKHLNGTFTVKSSLIATPTVQMNQQLVKCVIRHATMKEELRIDHKINVHYPPQLVFVTPFENHSNAEVYQCEADANPAATHFSWHSKHQTIPNDVIKIEGNKIIFLELTSDLNGMYICKASNEYGTGIGSLYWQKGDSGYPLRRWLLTPFLNPQSSEETHYNGVHSHARTAVERAIGILKCRCRALDASDGRLLYHPSKVCKIIRACGVLHNIALRNGIPLSPDLPLPQHYGPEPQPPGRQEGYQQGARIHENSRTASVSTRPLLDVPDAEDAPL